MIIMTQAELDARSGVLRYLIDGRVHRAQVDTEAEAVLWSAMGLAHAAAEERRRYGAMGRPVSPPGLGSLADLAACWEARVRRMVRVATTAEGYLGEDSSGSGAP